MIPFTENSRFTEARQQQIDRLRKNADTLFALGSMRQRCQEALLAFHDGLKPSPFAAWGVRLGNNEYRFAWALTLSYKGTADGIVRWVKGCMGEYLLQEVAEERDHLIEEFAQMKIASRWYQLKDDDQAWRVFALNIPFEASDREKEVRRFFETLTKISILTDILTGHASEYGLEVDYGNLHRSTERLIYTPSASRQSILEKLFALTDKGDWISKIQAEDIKTMLRTVLGVGESPLTGKEAEQSGLLWQLLENGRGDRVKIVWQNMVGYFDDRKLFNQKGSPALNRDFFGNDEGYPNIDKGRPSRDNMSANFREVLPLLDTYVPKR